jgi:Skp family chaperone for outer membrane proteins
MFIVILGCSGYWNDRDHGKPGSPVLSARIMQFDYYDCMTPCVQAMYFDLLLCRIRACFVHAFSFCHDHNYLELTMFKIIFASFAILFALASTGCNEKNPVLSAPLVVDLPAVARALGRDEEMTLKLEQARKQLSDQLTQVSAELVKQLQEKELEVEAASKKEKEEIRKELDQMTQEANVQLKNTQQLANQQAILYRDQLVDEFRKEVITVAENIAGQRNATTIITANSDLLWYASSVDITDEVIGAMRASVHKTSENSQGGEAGDEPGMK